MIPTIEFLKESFHKYNAKYFNNELHEPTFNFDTKRHWGCCGAKKHFTASGEAYYNHYITISIRCDRAQHSIEQTLIHEMIHLYFDQKGEWSVKHGAKFQAYAQKINKQSNGHFHISTYTDQIDTDIVINDVARKGYGSNDVISICVYKFVAENKYFCFAFSKDNKTYFENQLKRMSRYFDFCFLGDILRGTRFSSYPLCRKSFRGRFVTLNDVEEIKKDFISYKKI